MMIRCRPYNYYNTEEAAFEGDTGFVSVASYLSYSPYIQKLKFTNLVLTDYHIPNSKGRFSLPYLRELQFYGTSALDEDAYFLLDWINKNAHLPRLQSFSFTTDIRFWNDKTIQSQSNRFSQVIQTTATTVADFLINHRKTLRNLTICGPCLKLTDQGGGGAPLELDNSYSHSDLNALQLDSLTFSLDTPELHVLLENQIGLEILRCDRYQNADDIITTNVQSLFKCILRNSKYLKCIEITPVILDDLICDSLLDRYKVDCSIFKDCNHLLSLKLRMNFLTSLENWQNSVPGRVTNIHLLPKNLRVLEISTDKIDTAELKLLEERFEEFTTLRTFYLTCLTYNIIIIPTTWVEKLLNLNLNVAIFIGGKLDNLDEAIRLVNSNQNSRLSLTWAEDCRVIFEAV